MSLEVLKISDFINLFARVATSILCLLSAVCCLLSAVCCRVDGVTGRRPPAGIFGEEEAVAAEQEPWSAALDKACRAQRKARALRPGPSIACGNQVSSSSGSSCCATGRGFPR